MSANIHPIDPRSNVQKFTGYEPKNYDIGHVSNSVVTDEALLPSRPPCLTQKSIAMYLKPLTRELDEVPPRPTVAELPDAVIDKIVQRDKAFWVDKPGANAYTLTDAFIAYGMTSTKIDKLCSLVPINMISTASSTEGIMLVIKREMTERYTRLIFRDPKFVLEAATQCRECVELNEPALTRHQHPLDQETRRQRWRYYPNLTTNMTMEELRVLLPEVGRPFKNEACNWYYQHYPAEKYPLILRKCGK